MIPYCVVEEHHQVLPFWAATAGNGTLDFILTLDHHTDVLPAFSRMETKPEIDRNNPEKAILQLRHDEHIDWALRAGIMKQALILSHENFTEPAHPAMKVICPEFWPESQVILNSGPAAVSAAEKVLEPEYLQLAVSAEDLEKNYILDLDLDNFLCRKALHPENTEFFQELAKHAKGISISMERDWQRLLRLRGETLTSDDVLAMLETLIGQKFA